MRRLQHVLGMLIAMFALCSVLTLTGCNGGDSDLEDAAEEAADETEDAMDDVGDAAEDTMDDLDN